MGLNKVKITNIVKFYSVLLLSEGSKTGYEIIKEIGKHTEKKISPGQIYPFLKILESEGYLKSKKLGSRDKVEYILTGKGRKFVSNMLSRFGNLLEIAIQPKLSVCANCGCKVFEGSHKEMIGSKNYVFCCCHCAKSFKEELN